MEPLATLLERERELAELRSALSDARQGRGRLILAEGTAGLGKTSLLRAAADIAAGSGVACLRARANELERDFAYGCVRQLLEPAVAKASEPERERLFEGAASIARPLLAATERAPATAPADYTVSMLHGLYWLLNNLAAELPLLLCIDDLHWSDRESLQFLNYLAPRLDGLALAVFASARTPDRAASELARLAAAPETRLLRLEPLSIEATATLCAQVLGTVPTGDFAAACRTATGGNPFYLKALLREARERGLPLDAAGAARVRRLGPATVARAVLVRLAGAPDAATALVRAGAVLGDGASISEAAQLADLSHADAAHAADLLTTLGIFAPAETVEFAHPIVREAVYAAIAPQERMRTHAYAAAILDGSGASGERVAAQIAESAPIGEPGRVVLLRQVAAAALARGAPGAAVAWLRRALAEPPPPVALCRSAPRARHGRAAARDAGSRRAPRGGDRVECAVGAARAGGASARQRAQPLRQCGSRRAGHRVGDRCRRSGRP